MLQKSESLAAKTNSILYVEDNLADSTILENELRNDSFPFQVQIAHSLREAVNFLDSNDYQVVVSDFYLGDGEALDLFPCLNGTPLIIITREGSEDIAVKALQKGAHDYLLKDVSYHFLKILPITVAKAIEKRTQIHELEQYRMHLEQLVRERTNELTGMYMQLLESEANFRNIFDNSSEGYIITDYDFNFLEANNTLLSRFGVNKEYLASHALIEYLVPAYHALIFEKLELLKRGISSGDIEIEIISPISREIIWYEIHNKPIVFNNKNAILTVMRDISERKSMARKVFETIIKTEELERLRIAQDLHDEIGPLISALKIYMTSFQEIDNKDRKNELASQMGVIVRDLLEFIKNISNDMSPHILVNFGLHAAVNSIVSLFSGSIDFQFHSNIKNTRFSSIVESVFYRIIKELINNTIKHAQASRVALVLTFENKLLSCHYKDNGLGFDKSEFSDSTPKGMGLSNIKTRVQSLGGIIEINTKPDGGFEASFSIRTDAEEEYGK
jgi:PAS domain S-box-containing protein